MQPKGKLILLVIVVVVVVSIVMAWSFASRSIPDFNANPIPKDAPMLNEADIEKMLGVEQFRVVRRVRQVPNVVKESFSSFTQLPFDLVDPGEQMRDDDMTTPAKSSRRLVFFGLSRDSTILVYEQGGFVDVCNIVAFWFEEGGRGWAARLDRHSIPRDISTLKAAIQKGKYHTWERRD
jgi:hypothetical protein